MELQDGGCSTRNLLQPVCFVTSGQLYGLEKFWAFLKYSKTKTLEIEPKLQEHLKKFKRLEDFRIDVGGREAGFV